MPWRFVPLLAISGRGGGGHKHINKQMMKLYYKRARRAGWRRGESEDKIIVNKAVTCLIVQTRGRGRTARRRGPGAPGEGGGGGEGLT